ncbi:class I SAM-dependent methyltransferase [Actinoplanes aureus]|uniref:Class I SAM-dependent methyltransferase n=1 Tax=Actinoplanes aureus TaxID=2792083 RepID=A0A931FZF1_9ACTN|nr:methyltransferase domain-containing protein [Actinoplanes aureus]MBG0562921.1 class I SAM-dependent methyltransferase [Actinoplanes aureus]
MASEHAPHHHPGHGHGHDGDHDMTEMLDLDAEVASAEIDALTARIAELATTVVRDIIDVGSGTGTGSFALLRRFPEATVTAVDTSEDLQRHLAAAAGRHGLAGRIRPVRADLDAGWPGLGPADLVWASSSMHHMTDPDRVLRDVRAALRPGGLLVLVEMERMPNFLPAGFGDGLEDRLHAAHAEARAEHLPHIGSDWTARLKAAGFTVHDQHVLTVERVAPLPHEAVRYAEATLRRFRHSLADRLSAGDQATLDGLLHGGLAGRDDLTVISNRDVWIAGA